MIQTCFKKKLLGSEIEITLFDIAEQLAIPILEEAYLEGLRLQKIFNFYDSNSELSLLNKKRKMIVSYELLEVIKKALEYSILTKGEYDISLGKNILERKNNKPLTKINCSYRDIIIKSNEIILNNPNLLIDLGSIAKGYIVDKLVEFLKKSGVKSGFLDARGDIRYFGNHEEILGVQHPRENTKILLNLRLKNLSIATSGDYNQYFGSYDNSHILRKKELISVTVIAKDLTTADVFASAVFLLEKIQRERLIKQNPEFKILTVDNNMKIKYYNGFDKIIVSGDN